jgi:hypothetical protein
MRLWRSVGVGMLKNKSKMETNVVNASYIESYKLEILFSNDKKRVVDFSAFLETHSHPQYNKYKKENNF